MQNKGRRMNAITFEVRMNSMILSLIGKETDLTGNIFSIRQRMTVLIR